MAQQNAQKVQPTLRPRRRTQAAEQFWGYSLQGVRLLHLLLESPESSTISLEVFEDVGREQPGGVTLASQTKTALVRNPVTDRSVDLWKTFSNWHDAVSDGVLDVHSTIFELYLARKQQGSIVDSFSCASTSTEASEAIASARTKLWGEPPSYSLRSVLPQSLRTYSDKLLNPSNTVFPEIVMRFRKSTPKRSALGDLRPLVEAKWVRPELVEEIIAHARGWMTERVEELAQQRRPIVIKVADFTQEMRRFLPRLDFDRILTTVAGEPSADEVAAERVRTYVEQLKLIEAPEEDVIGAINAFLQASVARSKWAEAGIVHEQSFDDFEKALKLFWFHKRKQNLLIHKELTAIEKGQLLLTDCCLQAQPLQGLSVPSFFTPGSYHALADERNVGWHPDYEKKLRQRA
jgi:hypothetical protein